MTKNKGNRFEGFEDFSSDSKPTKLSTQSTPNKKSTGKTGKSADPNFKKVTLYLSRELHFKMRTHTLTQDEDMSELVERVINEYFQHLDG